MNQVRSSSLELLGSLYHRLGPPLKALLPSELRPALQSQVCTRRRQFTNDVKWTIFSLVSYLPFEASITACVFCAVDRILPLFPLTIVFTLVVMAHPRTIDLQVDDIFNKVGYDPAANAQVKRKAPGADGEDQSAGAGGGGLPRMDLSTLLDKVHHDDINLSRWIGKPYRCPQRMNFRRAHMDGYFIRLSELFSLATWCVLFGNYCGHWS